MLLVQNAVLAEEIAETETNDVIRIYVSPDGQDFNNGTEEKPYGSIDTARKAVQKMYKDKPVEVLIKAGTYKLNKSVEFTSVDSGTEDAPITYKAYGDGEVVFSGSKQIDLSAFKPITDPEILERLPAASRGRVGQVNLAAQGFTLNELSMLSNDGDSPFVEDYRTSYTPIIMGLYLNGYEQQLAKWPNRNFLTIKGVVGSDTIEYSEINPSRWTKAKDAFLAGYMYSEWTGGWQPIKEIDTEKRTIRVNTGGESVQINHRWSAINLLEEIDIPGEWYLDRETLTLYYYPEKYIDPENDVLEFAILPGRTQKGAFNLNGCSYVNFDGITIEKTYCTGIKLEACNNCSVKRCYIKDVGGNGIHSGGYGKNILLEENTIANCAERCIDMAYQRWGPYPSDEWYGLVSTGNVVRNNHLYNAGVNRYGMVWISGCEGIGTIFEHNLVHKGINTAANTSAPNSVLRYNELYNCVRETADAGAVYLGRSWNNYGVVTEYNYIHDLGDKEFQAGNLVDCIFWDDTLSGQIARYNILRPNSKTRTYGVINGGGRDCEITDNIIVDSDQSIGLQDRTTSLADGREYNSGDCWANLLATVGNAGSKYLTQYPQILKTYEEMMSNDGHRFSPDNNNVSNNVIVNAADINYASSVKNNATTIAENNYLGMDYSIFVDPENQDFRVKKSAKKELGLGEGVLDEDFDIKLIGVQTEIKKVDDSFSKTYPKNGDKGLDSTSVTLSWQKAPFADEYDYKVATDPEMKNVVAYGTTIYSNTVVEKLEKGTSYYWTVTAKNISRQCPKEWEAEGVPYMFTTANYDILVSENLKKQIQNAKDYVKEINEGTELGQHKPGTKQALLDKIEELSLIAKMTSGEQITINNAETEMANAINIAKSSINIAYNGTIDTSDPNAWETVLPDQIQAKKCDDGSLEIKRTTHEGIMSTKEQYSGAGVYTFDLKTITTQGWVAFGLRHSNIDSGNIYSANGKLNNVFIIIKPDVFELQSRNSDSGGGTLMITSPNNGIFKEGEWNRIEFGTVPAGDGIFCTLKINGQVIYEHLDNVNPVRTEGVFVLQPTKDVPMYIRAVDDAPTGEFVIPEESLGQLDRKEIIYTSESSEYREVGTWNIDTAKGYDNRQVRVATDPKSTVDFDLFPPGGHFGTYDVYYYHTPLEDGDKNATVDFLNLYVSYSKKLDFSKGESGWRKLGTYYFVDAGARAYMNIKFTPSGEGKLPVSAIKIQKVDDSEREFSEVFYQHTVNGIVMQAGNKTAYKDIEPIVSDQESVIVESRTLVPLRFVSEAFEADVEWDENSRTAVITMGDNKVSFAADSNLYTVNGEQKQFDSSARIINNRMMIPLRVFCEAIEKEVLWNDEGKIIIIADSIKAAQEDRNKMINACINAFK